MRSLRIGNKGITISEMAGVGLLFVFLGIMLGMGAYINNQVAVTGGFTAGTIANATAANATQGIAQLTSWLPIIAIVIAAGIVIGVLVQAFRGEGV